MNKAMKTLAELLDIDHAKMPREMMAEKSCEAALNKIGGDAAHLKKLAENIAHLQNERDELIAKNERLREALSNLEQAAKYTADAHGVDVYADLCETAGEACRVLNETPAQSLEAVNQGAQQ